MVNARFPGLLALCAAPALFLWFLASLPAAEPLPATIEFNRDIRPILSDTCFHCHGPDQAKRKANLRLDTEAGARADLAGSRALVPGHLDKSELYQRVTAKNERARMPPSKLGRPLTPRQVQLLARWIEQGAPWQPHWSFIAPRRPAVPQAPVPGTGAWGNNAIDAFILDRLQREGLRPAPAAERATLVRRVTLDLTGLPPTPDEVEAARNDAAADWYEKVVDRLLASPRYGERLGVRWLDAARYADTNGYQDDGERHMWRWRDWVIDAFNRNLPFDQFTIEQLAGDLLPNATLEQRIATGFNRNHRINAEGGIIPEEYAVEYVADRVETTATVWLGLTMTCCRCHDHKYDPLQQKEFYQLFAYFNNLPESGRGIKYGNSPPLLAAPTPAQQEALRGLDARQTTARAHLDQLEKEVATAQAAWEKGLDTTQPLDWAPARHLLAHFPLNGDANKGPAVAFEGGPPAYVEGRSGQAGSFDGQRFVNAGDVGDFGFHNPFTLSTWVYPTGAQGGVILSRTANTARATGYSVALTGGKVQVNLVVRWLDDALRVQTERALEPNRWHHLAVRYDGTKKAGSVQVFVDGRPEKLHTQLDALNQTFQTKEPFRIGAGGAPGSGFHGNIDEVRIYGAALDPDELASLAVAEPLHALVALPADKRTPPQAGKLRSYFQEQHAPPAIRTALQRWQALRVEREKLIERFPTTMVMQEMPTPRPTFLLLRGEYDKRGEPVTPGVPAALNPKPGPQGSGLGQNRLAFARWLVAPENPLTARVAVNRFWQMYFGTGLVKTVEDFGAQGEWPSHPELLDWLATEFVRTGWDVKAMQRLLVTSATYRQSSKVTQAQLERDPENRLLARGPRLRLSAEMVRDQALAASGLLVERLGGPSVKPYQPAGLWKELSGGKDYVPDSGVNLYRRSLYTFWKRSVTPPGMLTFDASMRETCVVRETRTNTPLQALNLMNDVTYVEASRVLAQRVLTTGGPTAEEKLTLAFRLVTGRPPKPAEVQVLRAGLEHHLAAYRKDWAAARKLVSSGDRPRDEKLDVAELAAYTAVAGLVLNLDEAITKE